MSKTYEDAIKLLTNLESNAKLMQKVKEDPVFRQNYLLQYVPNTRKYLEVILNSKENSVEKQLEGLKIIHISGTKGKGSTCAYIEKILRDQGFKTGLYTSPHLIDIRERIRINGEMISRQIFADEIVKIHQKLLSSEDIMPGFFQFLTILALHIFIHVEKVDVAIIEVGIGGEYDPTNILPNPVVCGITTLDLDHLNIMGSGEKVEGEEGILARIAWHKSGIFKENVPAFYMPVESGKAEEVIKSRAATKNTPLHPVPPITTYKFARQITPGIAGDHQFANISLALQIVQTWLIRTGKHYQQQMFQAENLVSAKICDSLENCRLAGRCQKIEQILGENGRKITWLLDGAHTPKSMECCAKWAEQEMVQFGERKRLLLVHCPDRNPDILLPILKPLNFSQAISCPTKYSPNISEAQKCIDTWRKLENLEGLVFENIAKSVDFIENAGEEDLVVLVTGNFHLVGGVIEKLG